MSGLSAVEKARVSIEGPMAPRREHEEETEKAEPRAATGPRPRVMVFWEGGSASRTLPSRGSLTLGRSVECGIQIDHRSVSRTHAILHVGDQLTIEDLG